MMNMENTYTLQITNTQFSEWLTPKSYYEFF